MSLKWKKNLIDKTPFANITLFFLPTICYFIFTIKLYED